MGRRDVPIVAAVNVHVSIVAQVPAAPFAAHVTEAQRRKSMLHQPTEKGQHSNQ